MSIHTLTRTVVDWADGIAPDRQPIDAAIKMVEEVSELLDAVANKGKDEVAGEIGDVMILMVDIASMYGFDPIAAAELKMQVNKTREYKVEDGVMRRRKKK